MSHAVGARHQNDNGDPQLRNVLLELEVAVHGEQHLEAPPGAPQKLAVLDPLPAEMGDAGDFVTRQLCGQVNRQVLVKKNAHG